jgi:hypothetical protein
MLYVCPVKQWGHESVSFVPKGSSFPRCYAVLLGAQLLTFQRTVVPSPTCQEVQEELFIASSTSFLLGHQLPNKSIEHPTHQYQIPIF